MKKAGIFKIKALSNFRGKNWRKIGKVDICTNPFEKKLPLSMGSLYADRCVKEMNHKEVKEKILQGDLNTLRSIYFYSNNIKGSQQMFSSYISKAYSFLRDIRIQSNDTEMFDLFLTFSIADNHWHDLHSKLPGSEQYLNKIVVKNESEIPSDAPDKNLYITER